MRKNPMANNTLGFDDRKTISEYLDTVLTVDTPRTPRREGTGVVHYTDPDMTDEKVAAHFTKEWSIRVTERNVAGVRIKAHGRIVSRRGPGVDTSALTTRLEALETTVLDMVNEQAKVLEQVTALAESLTAIAKSPVSVRNETSSGDKQTIRSHTTQIATLTANDHEKTVKQTQFEARLNEIAKTLAAMDIGTPIKGLRGLGPHIGRFRGK
jgi:hypothetical protein